jgi:hypothetical protein
MAKPYKSLTPNPDGDFGETCKIELDFDRAIATLIDHGCDSESVADFLSEHSDESAAITLGELRDFLGY